MRLDDFRTMVERLKSEIPAPFQGGVVEIEVSPRTVPHPVRAEIYTLGECIPLEWSGGGADLQSRIVLYHGSFQALAQLGDFDWREEAWETLTHELRHHLEWQANVANLEAYDWAAEQNFARGDGAGFDPVFYRNGEELAPGIFKVDDDVFIEGERGAGSGERDETLAMALLQPASTPLPAPRLPLPVQESAQRMPQMVHGPGDMVADRLLRNAEHVGDALVAGSIAPAQHNDLPLPRWESLDGSANGSGYFV